MSHENLRIQSVFGTLAIQTFPKEKLLLITASGIINPGLIRKELEIATKFGNRCAAHWTYAVDTQDVIFANPFNLYYLRKIRELPHLKRYIVFAPSKIVRVLMQLGSFLVQPDSTFANEDDFRSSCFSKEPN